MKNMLFKSFLFLFTVFAGQMFLYAQKNEIGSVLFSWDRAGDVTLLVQYKDEELQPLSGLHYHAGGYRGESSAQAQLRKVTRAGQLLAGNCYRNNRVKFNWLEYFKSFFWKPQQAGRQKLTLFDDGRERYEGYGGIVERLFRKEAHELLKEFEILQRLKTFPV